MNENMVSQIESVDIELPSVGYHQRKRNDKRIFIIYDFFFLGFSHCNICLIGMQWKYFGSHYEDRLRQNQRDKSIFIACGCLWCPYDCCYGSYDF